jgi:hypothetical protein
MKSIEFELDQVMMRIAVAEMALQYDRTPADIEAYAIKLKTLAVVVEKLAERAKQEAA